MYIVVHSHQDVKDLFIYFLFFYKQTFINGREQTTFFFW